MRKRILTGFRPTSELTLGNYFGAIEPAAELSKDPNYEVTAFIADLHGLTDRDPSDIAPHIERNVKDIIASGLDISDDSTTIYKQSDIESDVVSISNRLSPFISVAELARTPNLKEKIEQNNLDSDSLKSNLGLLSYPVLMAADIFSQNSEIIAVGEDQKPHIEMARNIGRRFNRQYASDGGLLIIPEMLAMKGLRVMALDGKGKMSKSIPKTALMLSDTPKDAAKKIKTAATAKPGEWNATIDSHFSLAINLSEEESEIERLNDLKEDHIAGGKCMGEFKKQWSESTERFLDEFAQKRARVSDGMVQLALEDGKVKAEKRSSKIVHEIKLSMGM